MLKLILAHKSTCFLLVLLSLSLYLNFRLSQERIEIYKRLNNLSLDPVNMKRFIFKKSPNISKNKTMVLLGDSRIASWTAPNLSRFEFINRGIGGQTSAQTLLRFEDHVSYLKPNIILLQVGGNDLRMIPLPPKTRSDVIADCKNNIKTIVEKSQKIGAKVIITTIFPLGKGEIPLNLKGFWREVDEMEQDIQEVNSYIRSLAKQNQVIVLDAYQILEENGKVKDKYRYDLLHINQEGYNQLNNALIPILNKTIQ